MLSILARAWLTFHVPRGTYSVPARVRKKRKRHAANKVHNAMCKMYNFEVLHNLHNNDKTKIIQNYQSSCMYQLYHTCSDGAGSRYNNVNIDMEFQRCKKSADTPKQGVINMSPPQTAVGLATCRESLITLWPRSQGSPDIIPRRRSPPPVPHIQVLRPVTCRKRRPQRGTWRGFEAGQAVQQV